MWLLAVSGLPRDGPKARERILNCIRAEPGVNKNEVGRRVGLSWTATAYHLRRLETDGHVRLVRMGRRGIQCFPGGSDERWMQWISTLRAPETAAILEAMPEGVAVGIGELSAKVGISEGIVTRALERLHAAGAVEKKGTYRPRFMRKTLSARPNHLEANPRL